MTFSYLAPHCALSALPFHFRSTSGPLLVNVRFTSGLDSMTTPGDLATHSFHRDEISFHSWDQFGCPPTGFSMTSSSVQRAIVDSEVFVRNWDICPDSNRPRRWSYSVPKMVKIVLFVRTNFDNTFFGSRRTHSTTWNRGEIKYFWIFNRCDNFSFYLFSVFEIRFRVGNTELVIPIRELGILQIEII